jgi:hypothetical protein
MKCEYEALVELYWYRETEVRGDKPVSVSVFSSTNSTWSGVRSNPLFIQKTLRKPRIQNILQHFFVKASCVCRLQRNRKDFGQLITSCYRFKDRKGWSCSAHATKEHRERRSVASLFLNLRTWRPYVVNFTPRPLYRGGSPKPIE